jgi:hypothetical protein
MRRLLATALTLFASSALAAGNPPAAPPPAGAPAAGAKPGAAPAAAPAKDGAAPADGAPSPPPPPAATPADIDLRMDLALKQFHEEKFIPASGMLYGVLKDLPENDLRRDTASYSLAIALEKIGHQQAAVEHYIEIITGRRSPELVGRGLAALDELLKQRQIDEQRLIDQVLFGNTFGDLPTETAEFVAYYQSVGELQRGFNEWGTKRLEELAKSNHYYGWKARYALAVERIAQQNDEAAEKLLQPIIDADAAPDAVRNDARQALARLYYEQKKFDEAFTLYLKVDSPLQLQDLVLLEKAWDRVASHDEPRALGMVVGLGAPVYHRLFAPERALIRAVALKRLCQFRAAHVAVLDFRDEYGPTLAKIHERQSLNTDPVLLKAVNARNDLLPTLHWRDLLKDAKEKTKDVIDKPLRDHLNQVYDMKLGEAQAAMNRGLDYAFERVAEELLRVNEQLTILDYEIGVGLFKSGSSTGLISRTLTAWSGKVPYGSERVYYRFSGEYWSDELQDFVVLAPDRCVK